MGNMRITLFWKLCHCLPQNIPIWEPGEDLHIHLSKEGNLAYAAVEGVVKELNRTLHSHYGNSEGVIMQSQLIEHKSQRVNGFWWVETLQTRSQVL